jgi:hypothetical protein
LPTIDDPFLYSPCFVFQFLTPHRRLLWQPRPISAKGSPAMKTDRNLVDARRQQGMLLLCIWGFHEEA